VARRGDVLIARRKLGFGGQGLPEQFVVLQSDRLRSLETVLVAPLDLDGPLYEADPLVCRVSAKEVGAKRPHVVLPYMTSAVLLERFEAAPAGRLTAASMNAVEAVLRLALELS
jgi:hypothetical protein